MDWYISFVLRRPKTVLVALAVITVLLSIGIKKLRFENSIDAMMPKRDGEYLYNEKIKKVYGNLGKFVILGVSQHNLWDYGTLKEIDDLISDIEEYGEFDEKRENSRIERLDSISGDSIGYREFIDAFADDPGFRRLLIRQIKKSFGEIGVLTEGALDELRERVRYSYDLKKLELVDEIISPFTMKDIRGEKDTLETYDLIEKDDNGRRILPKGEGEIQAFRKRLLRNPAFAGGLYARDPKSGEITDLCLLVRLVNVRDHDPIAREIWDIAVSQSNLEVVVQGIPIVNKVTHDYMQNDLINFMPFVMMVVVIVFFFNFRSARGVILPFVTLMMAVLWILGLIGHLGFKITIMEVSLPSLMIAVGSSYSIHILNQYYFDFDVISERGKREGLRLSMAHISITVLLAGLTTFVGFMTLATNQISAIREWGIFSAIGVLFAVLISTSIIPAVFVLMPHKMPAISMKKDKTVKKTAIDKIIRIVTIGSIKHSRAVLIVVIALIGLSIAGLFRLKVETSYISYFKEHDYIRTSLSEIGKKFGGAWGINILIDSGEANGIKRPEFLNTMEDLREWLVADGNEDLNVGRTDAFGDFIKTMHMAMNNDDLSMYRIPDSSMDILDYLEIYSGDDDNSDGRIDEFESYVDVDFRKANLFTRLWEKQGVMLGTAEVQHILNRISEHLDENLQQYRYRITGEPSIMIRLAYYVVQGQLLSLFLCLIVVCIIIMLLFKNWKAGLLALIPMGVGVTINFGIMGWFGINLDLATAIIASLTIGIGVDDTIHFLNTYRHNREKGLSVDQTIERTLAVSGKAIIFTSLALIFGFSVLVASNFVPIILFGILAAITMIATTIGALLVLPSVIKETNVSLRESESKSFIWRYLYIGKIFRIREVDEKAN
jgi:predicted RND superfamily exporter protein